MDDALTETAAGRLFCHAQFKGDDYTSRQLAKDILAPVIAHVNKLTTALSWIEDVEPELVEKAREKFGL